MAPRPGRDDDVLEFTDGAEDDGRGGQGPMLLSIALGLAMVVAILVTVWYFFADGRGPVAVTSGGVPVVQADPDAIKSKPSDPGGMEVPNQDKLVYERMGHGDPQAPPGERLLPPPEAPQAPPVQPKPEPPQMSLATPRPETGEAKPATPHPGEPPAATPAPQVAVAVTPEPKKPELKKPEPPKVEAPKVAAVTPPAAKPLEKPAEKPAPAVATPAPTPTPATAATPMKLGRGDYQIQLAALHDIEAAQRQWSKIAAANRDVLSGLSPDIVRADLGAKGVFFRLRAGPLDEGSARRLCEELGKRKIGCMVVHK